MKTKRIFALLMTCCLILSLAACGIQAKASPMLDGIFPAIAGENGTVYESLFEVILDEQYDNYWNEKCASIVGQDAAEASAQMLKSSISRDIYGQEAIDVYARSGDMGFDCWYINGAKTFEFKGDQITTTLTDGTSSTHTYEYLGVYTVGEGETMEYGGQTIDPSFDCDVYKSADDAGEFTYFFLRDDTMEETYHIEFRYGSDLEQLQGYFVGSYAYWLCAGIDQETSEETIHNVIDLFITENLSVDSDGETAAATAFAADTGTEEDPYQIETVSQLSAFRDSVNDGSQGGYAGMYIQLTADLDMSGTGWMPIGTMEDMDNYTTMFLGNFDGSGHTISNLTYETENPTVGAGLFGINCGMVKNLTLENVTVTVTDGTSLAIGGVVGYNMGAVDSVTIKNVTVTGNNCTGGIVGGNMGPVSNCHAEDVEIIVIGDNDFSAGLVQDDIAECGGLIIGGGFGGTIDNCTARGTIRAEGNEPVGLGGIGGCLEMMDSITNCSATVTIETKNGGHAIGGLCGYAGTHSNPDIVLETEGFSTTNYPCVVDNCSVNVTMDIPGATHVGGLIGTGLYYFGEETAFVVTNCQVTGSINGAVTPGAVAGRAEGSSVDGCTYQIEVDGVLSEHPVGETTCMYESADQ